MYLFCIYKGAVTRATFYGNVSKKKDIFGKHFRSMSDHSKYLIFTYWKHDMETFEKQRNAYFQNQFLDV